MFIMFLFIHLAIIFAFDAPVANKISHQAAEAESHGIYNKTHHGTGSSQDKNIQIMKNLPYDI